MVSSLQVDGKLTFPSSVEYRCVISAAACEGEQCMAKCINL